jgi:hypothetical protein
MSEAFTFSRCETGYASIRSATCVFVRFRPDMAWEFYEITQSGRYRGLERFYRMLTAEECARLTKVFDAETAPHASGYATLARYGSWGAP